MGKYWAYNRPLNSIEVRQRRELFQSEGYKEWLEEKLHKHTPRNSGRSDCCGAKVVDDLELCSECKEHCERITEED